MELGLQGKHAIVTGGSRGIGKAIARELAREGVDLAIVARSKEQLATTARELEAETGRRVIPLAADVTSKEQVDRMVAQAAERLGGLHILVNSGSPPGGSATATGPIETVVDEDLLHDFNVKYVGALRCARARGTREQRASYDWWVDSGLALVGSPETVRGKLAEQHQRIGYDVLCANHRFGAMPPEQSLKSLQLFGEEVIPAFS